MTAPDMIDVDLFAAAGGLDEGRRMAGHDDIPLLGIEWEMNACRTAVAAGHTRVRADVATFPCEHLRGCVRTLLGGPPCPTFSAAGLGNGRLALDLFVWAVVQMLRGNDVRAEIRERHTRIIRDSLGPEPVNDLPAQEKWRKLWAKAPEEARDAALVLEPARWIHATNPENVILEQVPAVFPIWDAMAAELRRQGWSVRAVKLNAADYGVPQTRVRAVLLGSRVRKVAPPEATHAEHPADDLFGSSLQKWVSMATALGWGMTGRPYFTLATAGGTRGGPDEQVGGSNARAALYGERDAGRWQLRMGNQPNSTIRDVDEPAPTLAFGNDMASAGWSLRAGSHANASVRSADEPAPTLFFAKRLNEVSWVFAGGSATCEDSAGQVPRTPDQPAHTITGKGTAVWKWAENRPATTVQGDPRIAPPGHRDRAGGEPAFPEGTIRITIEEASALQSFPPGYPWQGGKTSMFGQVGNCVPPLLSAHMHRAVLGPARVLEATA